MELLREVLRNNHFDDEANNFFPLVRKYSKQKAQSRVQSTTNGGKLLTWLFLFCRG